MKNEYKSNSPLAVFAFVLGGIALLVALIGFDAGDPYPAGEKYKTTSESKTVAGRTLYRIEATRDIPKHEVKKGDKGGWIEHPWNLLQDGDAWLAGNASVAGDAFVGDNAIVQGYATVRGNAKVQGYAKVGGNAEVYGNAIVAGNAKVIGYPTVGGKAIVHGNAIVQGYAKVAGNEILNGN